MKNVALMLTLVVATACSAGDVRPSLSLDLRKAEIIPRMARERLGRDGLGELLDAPAGKHGFVTADPATARLVFEDGTPARFFGICHNGYNNCWTEEIAPEKIEAMLDELVFLGVNLVRMFSTPGVIDRGAFCKGLHPVAIANRDRFIAEAKKRGIYIHMNLGYSGGKLRKGRNPFADEFDVNHTSSLLTSTPVVEARKRFVRALLNHVNPHTGLAYKDESAIISWQLGNELHAFSRGWGGRGLGFADWSKIREPHRKEMVDGWQAFLRARYGTRDALAAAWGNLLKPEEDPVAGTVALTNPAYPKWFDEWLPDKRQADAIAFADSLQRRYYQTMRSCIRDELGDSRHLISDNGWIRGSELIRHTAAENLDLMDLQHYWPHLSWKRTPLKPTYRSPLKDMALGMLESMLTARGDSECRRPGIVTEYNAHIDCVHSGEIFPLHSVIARLAGVDGEIAWLYWPHERYWEHWFAISQHHSPLPQRLIPFAAASLLWRQDIPAGDLSVLDRVVQQFKDAQEQQKDQPETEELTVDRDGASTRLLRTTTGRFPATPDWLTWDVAAGQLQASQPTWELFMGTGSATGMPVEFTPDTPDARYMVAVFALDGKPLPESRRIRLFANSAGVATGQFSGTRYVYACDRFARVHRLAKTKDGRFSVRDENTILFYDIEKPVSAPEVVIAGAELIDKVTANSPSHGSNLPANAADGSVSSAYMPKRNATPFPHDITMTFRATRAVCGVRIHALSGLSGGPRRIEVLTSPDGSEWRSLVTAELSWQHWDDDQGAEHRDVAFPSVTTQHIRVRIHAANMGWNGYRIHEIEWLAAR